MSLTVEERLRRYTLDLDAAAQQRPQSDGADRDGPPLAVDVVESDRTDRRRRALVAVAACLLLVVGAAIALLHGRRPSRPGIAPPSGSDWLVPNEIPAYHLWFARSLQTGLDYQERYRMQLARPTGNGGYTDPVTVTIGDSLRLWNNNEGVRTTVDVDGQSGEIFEDINNGLTVLQYQRGDGDAVVFTDDGDPISSETKQLLQEFAAVVKPADDGSLHTVGELPDDYQVLVAMTMDQEFGAAPLLQYIDNDTHQALVEIETETFPPADYELFKMGHEIEPIAVRGVTGWFTVRLNTSPNRSQILGPTGLFWRERTGQVVSIVSNGQPNGREPLTKAELVAIANDLHAVSESEWQGLAQTAESTGPGVGAAVGPTQVAFPTPPAGYRLDFAHLVDINETYGQARYVALQDPTHQPVIDILLRNWTPQTWQSKINGALRDSERSVANGRRVIDTSPGLSDTPEDQGSRAVAMEWFTDVIVEIVVYTPDHTPLGDAYDNTALTRLANTVNGVDFFTPGPINTNHG
jgi:hypothetical protein